MAVREIFTEKAPRPIAPYSQATQAGDFLFISGCLGLCPTLGVIKNSSVREEVTRALDNLENIVFAAGTTLSNVVKVNIFVRDLSVIAEVNEIYQARFSPPFPARTAVAVSGLPLDARIEIEAIALLGQA